MYPELKNLRILRITYFFIRILSMKLVERKMNKSGIHDLKLRRCLMVDKEFMYKVKKQTMKTYVEMIWGDWNEDFQRQRFNKNFNLQNSQIVQLNEEDIGILIIGTSLFFSIYEFFVSSYIVNSLQVENILFKKHLDFNYEILILGFILLIIAQVFIKGTEIKEEIDLTI